MALTNEYEVRTCAKYSARDAGGFVHCFECSLVVDGSYLMCKANSHYDRRLKEWVLDEDYTERRMANDYTGN